MSVGVLVKVGVEVSVGVSVGVAVAVEVAVGSGVLIKVVKLSVTLWAVMIPAVFNVATK